MTDVKKPLTAFENFVINKKGTEKPFTGKFTDYFEAGVYKCRNCDARLYESKSKFHSGCGWPSFDDEIEGAVKRVPDADGMRVEIVCQNCGGHLGHVFEGEGFTDKNTRHCVNSISLVFEAEKRISEVAILASGCFWGTEYHLTKAKGVLATKVGYSGGSVPNPTYEQVCTGATGHLECVKVDFDPTRTTYRDVLKLFFETHDFSQTNGQGPDIGTQYLSGIFVKDEDQRKIAENVIQELRGMGLSVATKIYDLQEFYPAEEYHQDYYERKGENPYCHIYRPIWT